MVNKKYIIEEKVFNPPKGVKIKEYGEEFDPWCGYDAFTLSKEDVNALLEGKVLETDCAYEYGVLIRMEIEK